MKILILGHGGHGKDTFAEMIQRKWGLTFQSSSRAALDAIYPHLVSTLGITDKEELYRTRSENRGLWKGLITAYNTPDKSRLACKIIETSDMYVGMRCINEYQASKHLFDKVYFVDAMIRLPTESTMSIPYLPLEMEYIYNHGPKSFLLNQVAGLEL